jgi:hypothetical protein
MTGAELADAVERFLDTRPDLSRAKSAVFLRGRRTFRELRGIARVKPETSEKAEAFIADPPAACAYIKPEDRKPRTNNPMAGLRRVAGIRRRITEQARAVLDSGVILTGKGNSAIWGAINDIQAQREAQHRATDPTEQALLKLRRQRYIVYRASVRGGPHNRFYISSRGGETISETQLLKMARAV